MGSNRIEADFGALHVLVNNAGIEVVAPMSETSLDEWRAVMAVNLDGVFLGCKALLPLLIKGGSKTAPASVINISSIAALIGFPKQVTYSVSKSGVRHLAKCLAIEWADLGHPIRVNSLHPGPIRTPMLEMAVEGWAREGILPADDPWGALAAMCPLNSVGQTSDVADATVYLASDEARWITGIELVVDGGYTAR